MKKVFVYAFEKKTAEDRYQIINMPDTQRFMLCPFNRQEICDNGVWQDEGWLARTWRRWWHNAEAPQAKWWHSKDQALKTYSNNEIKGRTKAQGEISHIFEQSCHFPTSIPIVSMDGSSSDRIIIVEIDLDNLDDVQPVILAENQRWQLKAHIKKIRDDFKATQLKREKENAEEQAGVGLGLTSGLQSAQDSLAASVSDSQRSVERKMSAADSKAQATTNTEDSLSTPLIHSKQTLPKAPLEGEPIARTGQCLVQ